MSADSLDGVSMVALFRLEAETQCASLTAGLLALERNPTAPDHLEACMRAAHSLKGAAQIVGLSAAVRVAHAMEDGFVAAQKGERVLRRAQIDRLLAGVDLLNRIGQTPEAETTRWNSERKGEIDAFLSALADSFKSSDEATGPEPVAAGAGPGAVPDTTAAGSREALDRVLRVTADNLNRLLGLAGESRVESRWLKPYGQSLQRLKRMQHELSRVLDTTREALSEHATGEAAQNAVAEATRQISDCQQFLTGRLVELELFDRRSTQLAHRLYEEAVACRMRPFADGIQGFPRMVRDLAHSLAKEVRLNLVGEATPVDREILERLEAPIGHLLRNAVDHGLETPADRRASGKPSEGTLRLEAGHRGGMLLVTVEDDGRGIDAEKVRRTVVRRGLTNEDTAAKLSDSELLEFLFLPGFSMREAVTEISGRGVGLDVVQTMAKQVRGTVRVWSQPGRGTRFQLQLPLTLSVVRALLVDIAGEPYAFPLAYITRTLKLPKDRIETLEGRQHFHFEGRQIGLITAHQVLERGSPKPSSTDWPVVVVGDHGHSYGVLVDSFLGERELVVQPLDPRLGKIKDIAAGALMEDGAPVLILDVEDLVRSVEKLAAAGQLNRVQAGATAAEAKHRKKVLVVDDSLTVRELERKLIESRGYTVEIAVNGVDAWNAVRTGHFNLVVTDVDMPRMDGIELVTLIKKDANLKALPVMIVSYKDREEDRRRGLEAGADYYLTKGSFHDETLLQSVVDLIGEADA